jgi:preprotein translocase subunit SecF
MLRILHGTHYDFIKYWKHAAITTIVFIVVGLTVLVVKHPNFSIEFTGGTTVHVRFAPGQPAPEAAAVRQAATAAGFPEAIVTTFGSDRDYTISAQRRASSAASRIDSTGMELEAALHHQFGDTSHVQVIDSQFVGSTVGNELEGKAIKAILISFIVTLIYLAIRFEWRFGLAATCATMHDILTTLAFIAMMRLEVSLTVVAAILTVIGYSLNDTIIIFDRVRENLKKQRKEPLRAVLNRSINETLPRSILTHATALTATLALLVFAGATIRPFAWVMAFGIFTGTFSSVYVAGAILLWIEQKWPRQLSTDTRPASRQGSSARTPVAGD